MNKEFFEKKLEKHTIKVNDVEPLNLFFGLEGSRFLHLNDVIIIPFPNQKVDVTLFISDVENTTLTIANSIEIYQRPCENLYPYFDLFCGEKKFTRKHNFTGNIKIKGNCEVYQQKYILYDS